MGKQCVQLGNRAKWSCFCAHVKENVCEFLRALAQYVLGTTGKKREGIEERGGKKVGENS